MIEILCIEREGERERSVVRSHASKLFAIPGGLESHKLI